MHLVVVRCASYRPRNPVACRLPGNFIERPKVENYLSGIMSLTVLESKDQFDAFIKDNKLVVIDFFADWCGPCRNIAPKYKDFASKYTDIKFGKVNVDDAADVAEACGISAMPTFQFYKNGARTDEFKGASESKLEEYLKKLLE